MGWAPAYVAREDNKIKQSVSTDTICCANGLAAQILLALTGGRLPASRQTVQQRLVREAEGSGAMIWPTELHCKLASSAAA
jgi:hypothetical protein